LFTNTERLVGYFGTCTAKIKRRVAKYSLQPPHSARDVMHYGAEGYELPKTADRLTAICW